MIEMADKEIDMFAKPYLMAIAYAFTKLDGLGYVTDGQLKTEFMNGIQQITIDAKVTIEG